MSVLSLLPVPLLWFPLGLTLISIYMVWPGPRGLIQNIVKEVVGTWYSK